MLVATTLAAENSVKFGSVVTGAPGQPVKTGNLLSAWSADVRGEVGTVSCNVRGKLGDVAGYAEIIEDGIAPSGKAITYRSPTMTQPRGGPHAVKLTRAGLNRLVEIATREQVGNDA